MSKPGFYNDNVNRAYPFVLETALAEGLENGLIADCGFVTGLNDAFDFDTDKFYLAEISASAMVGLVRITCGNSGLMTFGPFDLTGADYQTIFAFVGGPGGVCVPPENSVEGYVVMGRIVDWLTKFPGGDGDALYTDVEVEPARIQNLFGSYVSSFNMGNSDRTRVTAPAGCDPIVWDFPTNVIHNVEQCIRGHIALREGYNTIIRQDTQGNRILIGATAGGGLGEPCEQIEVFPGELAAVQGMTVPFTEVLNTLDGSLRCNEVVRSINGAGGRLLDLLSRKGATITPLPNEHRIIVDVDNNQLAVCIPGDELSELPSEISEVFGGPP